MRGLIFRKTAVSLGSTTLVTWEKKVIADALARGIVSAGSVAQLVRPRLPLLERREDRRCRHGQTEKIMSAEYDLIFGDEATELTLNDWEVRRHPPP
jgi:hypothetical protein